MIWLDEKYACMLPLQGFEIKRNGNQYANFRCFVCGDSYHKQTLKRGWFYEDAGGLTYHCYNCGYHNSIRYFMREFFQQEYEEYSRELFIEQRGRPTVPKKSTTDTFDVSLINLKGLLKISDLPSSNEYTKYCTNRLIPEKVMSEIYVSDNFYSWCKELQPDSFSYDYKSDKRIIFPLIDKRGMIFGATGRSITGSSVKYLTIKFSQNVNKIYGLNRLNLHKQVYVCEGAIDSLYIENCIAVLNGLGGLSDMCDDLGLYERDRVTVITDNEPRNKHTNDFISKNLMAGFGVIVWPESVNGKDINEMLINGYKIEDIFDLISHNTFHGMKGLLKLAQKRKY